jgi:hypothetical protein
LIRTMASADAAGSYLTVRSPIVFIFSAIFMSNPIVTRINLEGHITCGLFSFHHF